MQLPLTASHWSLPLQGALIRHRPKLCLLWLWQVATRRTRTAGKVEIPNVDDHVSKLEHMGKETVKKLQDIKGAAIQAGVDINIPENCINKGACCGAASTVCYALFASRHSMYCCLTWHRWADGPPWWGQSCEWSSQLHRAAVLCRL